MIYLNNAATSYPKPDLVLEVTGRCISGVPGQQNRGGVASAQYDMESCRRRFAEFFGVSGKGGMVFTPGATQSLNTLIFGMIKPGMKVVTTVTEHNSVLRPLYRLQDEGLIGLEIIGCDSGGHIDIDALYQAVKEGASTAVINHVSNVTGAVQNIAGIKDICFESGVELIIDASQSCGHVPLDELSDGTCAFAFTGHKGLFGLQGSGGLFLPGGKGLQAFHLRRHGQPKRSEGTAGSAACET
jgi:selenocysteine lyase/cysteine desulfurase